MIGGEPTCSLGKMDPGGEGGKSPGGASAGPPSPWDSRGTYAPDGSETDGGHRQKNRPFDLRAERQPDARASRRPSVHISPQGRRIDRCSSGSSLSPVSPKSADNGNVKAGMRTTGTFCTPTRLRRWESASDFPIKAACKHRACQPDG